VCLRRSVPGSPAAMSRATTASIVDQLCCAAGAVVPFSSRLEPPFSGVLFTALYGSRWVWAGLCWCAGGESSEFVDR
jgi:hypothetical protein